MHLRRGGLQQLLPELKEAPRASPHSQPRPPVSKRNVSQPTRVDRNLSSDTVRCGGAGRGQALSISHLVFLPFLRFGENQSGSASKGRAEKPDLLRIVSVSGCAALDALNMTSLENRLCGALKWKHFSKPRLYVFDTDERMAQVATFKTWNFLKREAIFVAKRTGPSRKEQTPYDGKSRAFVLKDARQED